MAIEVDLTQQECAANKKLEMNRQKHHSCSTTTGTTAQLVKISM